MITLMTTLSIATLSSTVYAMPMKMPPLLVVSPAVVKNPALIKITFIEIAFLLKRIPLTIQM